MFYLNTKEMLYILTILKEKNLSKAAEKLYTTQPNLTRVINKEESKMGLSLFDKSTNPWSLTYAGEIYVAAAKEFLNLNENLFYQINSIIKEEKGLIKLGMMDFEQTYLMPEVLPSIKQKLPQVKLIMQTAPPFEVTSLLYKKLVDFGIIVSENNIDIEYIPIKSYDIILALPINHPLSYNYRYVEKNDKFPELDPRLLSEEYFILIRGSKLAQTISSKLNFKLKIEQFVDTPYGALAATEAGLGATFVLDAIAKDRYKLKRAAFFKLKGMDLKQEIAIAYLKNKTLNSLEKSFLQIFADFGKIGLQL